MLTDLQEHVIYIADELDAVGSGEGVKCPHCGTIVKTSFLFARFAPGLSAPNDPDMCTCPECGHESPRGEYADVFPADWLCENGLDIEYRVSSSGDYLGARVCTTLGGPTIWVATDSGRVCGSWGSEKYDCPAEAAALDDLCRETFEMLFER